MTAKIQMRQEIVMNFSAPPSPDDMMVMVRHVIDTLPDELTTKCENLLLEIEELADEAISQDMDLENPYELLALFHSALEVAPGVQRKSPMAKKISWSYIAARFSTCGVRQAKTSPYWYARL